MTESCLIDLLIGCLFGAVGCFRRYLELIAWIMFVVAMLIIFAIYPQNPNTIFMSFGNLIIGVVFYLLGYYGMRAWIKNLRGGRK